MNPSLHLELPADARFLSMTRRAVGGYLRAAGIGEDERSDVVLALDEACVNVIRHAFPDDPDGRIRLLAEMIDGGVRVQVEDDGVGFDPAAPRRQTLPWDTSGRGLDLIRSLMTSVELESPSMASTGGGTRLVMQKATPGPTDDRDNAAG